MTNSTCKLAGDSALRAKAAEMLSAQTATASDGATTLAVLPDDLRYFSFPRVFGSTSGPFGGIGGQAMTTFQIDAFEDEYGRSVWFCAGRPVQRQTDELLIGFLTRDELHDFQAFVESREKQSA